MSDDLLVYGAYGYTGELVSRRAVAEGMEPVLAGRDGDRLEDLADDLGLARRTVGLERQEPLREALADVAAVLNCAGPFADTHEPVVEACLATGTDYLDVTGELGVFEAIAARDAAAEDAGVTLLPGVGFDVVPSDCLAAHLADRLPEATGLRLGFDGALDRLSPGTAKTIVRNADRGGVVRRDGALKRVPAAWRTRRIDFGDGPRLATTFPWGDVSTAYHSTGIPNVEFYVAVSPLELWALRSTNYAGWLLGSPPVAAALESAVDWAVAGPDERERAGDRVRLWGEATDGDRTVVARMVTPNGYETTARTAVAAARRVIAGEAGAGFLTPSVAFGAGFARSVEGIELTDE